MSQEEHDPFDGADEEVAGLALVAVRLGAGAGQILDAGDREFVDSPVIEIEYICPEHGDHVRKQLVTAELVVIEEFHGILGQAIAVFKDET